jgi:hypothetical protein
VSSPHKVAGRFIVCESQFEVKRPPGQGISHQASSTSAIAL